MCADACGWPHTHTCVYCALNIQAVNPAPQMSSARPTAPKSAAVQKSGNSSSGSSSSSSNGGSTHSLQDPPHIKKLDQHIAMPYDLIMSALQEVLRREGHDWLDAWRQVADAHEMFAIVKCASAFTLSLAHASRCTHSA